MSWEKESEKKFRQALIEHAGHVYARTFINGDDCRALYEKTFNRKVSQVWLFKLLKGWKKRGWLTGITLAILGGRRGVIVHVAQNKILDTAIDQALKAPSDAKAVDPEKLRVRLKIRERIKNLGVSLGSWQGIMTAAGWLHVEADSVAVPELAGNLQRASTQLKLLEGELLGNELKVEIKRAGLSRREVSELADLQ